MRLTRPLVFLPILLLIVVTPSLAALTPESSLAAYESMKRGSYGEAQPIPAGGITIKRDVATFTMTSGTIRLMKPAGGASHGLIFEGTGTMKIEVPNPTELYQLRRFTGDPSLESLESTFTELFIRTSDDAATLTGLTFGGGADENATAEKRHEHWVVEEWLDADARIIAAALNDMTLAK